jgi:hypothetical protein
MYHNPPEDHQRDAIHSAEARAHIAHASRKHMKYPRAVIVDRKGSAKIAVKQRKPSGPVFIFPNSVGLERYTGAKVEKRKKKKHKKKK